MKYDGTVGNRIERREGERVMAKIIIFAYWRISEKL